MDQDTFKNLILNSPYPFTLLKIHRDDNSLVTQISFELTNQAFLDLFQLTQEELFAKGFNKLFSESTDIPLQEYFIMISEENLNEEFEYNFTELNLLIRINAFRYEKDFVAVYIRDITQLKKLETISKAIEEDSSDIIRKYKAVFQSTYVGVVLQSSTGEILDCNHTAEQMLGLSKEQLMGRTSIDPRWRSIHENGEDFPGYEHPSMISLKTALPVKNVVMGVYHPEKNKTAWIEIDAEPLFRDNEDKPYAVIATFQDITHYKNALIEFSNASALITNVLYSATRLSILATNQNGIITLFNKGAENLLGYDSKEVVDKFTPIIFHKEQEIETRSRELSTEYEKDIRGFEVFITKTLEEGFEQREWTYIRKDKTEIPVSMIVSSMRDLNNSVNGYLVIAEDITLRKQAELYLIQTKEEAEAASKAKSEFLANMSHEIRTPLNAIIGFTDILMNTELNQNQKDYLNNVNHSGHILLNLINDILDFSKIEAGKLQLEYSRTDILHLLDESLNLFKLSCEVKKLNLSFKILNNVPRFIACDPLRLKQVIVNLIGNSVKFTSTGSIKLILDYSLISKERKIGQFSFSIEDTGVGISEYNQKKLFKAFSQADTSTTRKFGGTGLGLTISNALVNMMGGSIQLESEFGKGSRFYFSVNLEFLSEEFIDNSEIILSNQNSNISERIVSKVSIQTNQTNSESKKLYNQKILIAEDVPLNLALLKAKIPKMFPGVQIIEAVDGVEAVDKYKYYRPDIFLTDIQMPNKDGYEATIEIRNLENENSWNRVPIIAVTANAVKGEREKCLGLGMDEFITKPIIHETLKAILGKYLAYPL
ncbi:MAG: PAS domain S-box protein [Leptospiraceae bacterium]|nr:PAS domain S-box protein [Leptospiraceae bacterium]